MKTPFVAAAGGILSADIAVPSHEQETRFYAQVLTTGREPLWREDLMNNRGQPVIGLGPTSPEYAALPLQWMPHFQVPDVAASAARGVALGGTELMHGRDDNGQSQWAVLVDAAGAAFGLIPVVDAAQLPAIPTESLGRIAWVSLTVADVPSACRFYEQVVGWSAAPADSDGACEMRRPDGGASAAIHPATDAGVPAAWLISLPVGDLGESLERVREAGGEIISGSADAGQAVIRDPVGVYLALQAEA